MRVGRNILFGAPALAVALLIVTTIAAADTPAPAPVGLARGELVGLAQADPDVFPATPAPAAAPPPAH
jgi:hypothetical protein